MDRKADLEILRRVNDSKANKTDVDKMAQMIDEINSKIKHISVYNQELAQVLIPAKESGKFAKQDDLNDSIKRRGELFKMG